jgi:hypothetical protein
LLVAVAIFGCAFVVSSGRATANSEICPAEITESYAFPADTQGGLYSFVLDSASEQTARGTIVVSTNAGYFTFAFPDTKFDLDRGRFTTASTTFTRDRYLTVPLYVRFPAGVTDISKWWVTKAQTRGEKVFGWDAIGSVSCSLAPLLKPAYAGAEKTATRVNPIPYDLTVRPTAQATVTSATATAAPGSTSCATPFSDGDTKDAIAPDFPPSEEGALMGSPMVTTVVKVFIDMTGAVVDTMVYQPSGYADIDQAALAAALKSTYSGAISFCEPVPSSYLFRADFSER